MQRIKGLIKENYIVILSFFLTFFLYFLILIINKDLSIETIMYSDMYEQYSNFFNYVRDNILNNNGLFNSFSFSLGQNFYGILTYFCLSPLNLILLFSNSFNMPYFLIFLILIKFGLSASMMAYYLQKKLGPQKSIILFAMLYGLMAYNLTYYVNIMWLDCVYLLPLIILGFERMIDENKFCLYTLSLTLAIISNYYIAFSICIFLAMYFIYYNLLKRYSFKQIILKLKTFLGYSIIAVLFSSIVLIPTIFNMLDGKFNNTETNLSFTLNYNPIYLLYKFMIGDNKILLSDLPLISSSLLVLILFIIYFFNKKITKREKIVTLTLTIVLILITLFPILDTILHCFRIPNQFTYRYAFIISFFLITVAYQSFSNWQFINNKSKILYLIIGLLLINYLRLYIGFKTITTCILIIIYFGSLILCKNKKVLIIIILPLFIMELAINITTTINEGTRIPYNEYTYLLEHKAKFDKLSPSQNEFYRISGNRVTYNDSFNLNYYGVTSFSPTISINANRFLKDYLGLGLHDSYAIEAVSMTKFSESLLGIKYSYLFDNNDLQFEENKYVFPVLSSIDKKTNVELNISKIENQNNLYKYLSGNKENIFTKVDDYEMVNCKIDNNKLILLDTRYCEIKVKEKSDKYKYYIEIKSDDYKLVPIFDFVETTEQYGTHFILDITDRGTIYMANDIVNLEYFNVYKLDLTKLQELSNQLKENELLIKKHNNNTIVGTINNTKTNRMLFTTIPYDEGWHVVINGKEVQTYINIDSLLAFDLPVGELEIEMYFIPKGFMIGLIVTMSTFLVTFVVCYRKKFLIEEK